MSYLKAKWKKKVIKERLSRHGRLFVQTCNELILESIKRLCDILTHYSKNWLQISQNQMNQ